MMLIEACCGSADDVIQAARGGADRVELNSALFLGGLTPTPGCLEAARARVTLPIMAMLRPREGGFCYTAAEFDTMLRDGRHLLAAGADGLVFGCLHADGSVDEARTRELVALAEGRDTVFHRAIDVVPDWKRALDALIRLGVTRVLTSGQSPAAFYGAAVIAEMRRFAGNAIEILPGAGITLQNARQLAEMTGCTQLHLSHRRTVTDPSATHGAEIHFGGALYPPEDCYKVTDAGYFAALRELFNKGDE